MCSPIPQNILGSSRPGAAREASSSPSPSSSFKCSNGLHSSSSAHSSSVQEFTSGLEQTPQVKAHGFSCRELIFLMVQQRPVWEELGRATFTHPPTFTRSSNLVAVQLGTAHAHYERSKQREWMQEWRRKQEEKKCLDSSGRHNIQKSHLEQRNTDGRCHLQRERKESSKEMIIEWRVPYSRPYSEEKREKHLYMDYGIFCSRAEYKYGMKSEIRKAACPTAVEGPLLHLSCHPKEHKKTGGNWL
ncbi:hypothetical protein LR48_Vigan07g131700 [Vigna angularis]|uniref:Uncharacterized protein n=1 Tax=Phaseolus angularis TaxID=3914 RepID=A0A0L9UXW5_PHAAN|nr:hypothetical protein LR48_Vigan07g131700 [Vigna angularis]